MRIHNGEITIIGSWYDAAGERHNKYVATSFHPGEGVSCELYMLSAAEHLLWMIDTRVEGKAFRTDQH